MPTTLPFDNNLLIDALFDELYPVLGSYEDGSLAAKAIVDLIDSAITQENVVGFDLRVIFPFDDQQPDIAVKSQANGYLLYRVPIESSDVAYAHRGWKIGGALCGDVQMTDEYTAVIAVRRKE